VNHEPTKLALLISLICAGAPTDVFGKTEGTTERQGLSQEACAWVRDLAAPQAWPLILNGIRDAEAGSLGLSLLASTTHEFEPPWREAEADAVENTDEKTRLSAAEPDLVDPLERANAASQTDNLVVPASTPAVAAVQSMPTEVAEQDAIPDRTKTLRERSLAVDLTLEDEVPQRAALVVTPSAQRVMRNLAAIRFPAMETMVIAADTAVVPTATTSTSTSATPTPTATLDPTPSARVLATLSDVLTAPAVNRLESDVTDLTKDDTSLEAAIAARQEAKRMRQRARAEEAALAKVAKAQTTRSNPFGGERVAVRDNALDRVRGGFVTPGLNISFGIERAVYINGALVTTTSLNISDLGRVTSSTDAKALTPGALALIQSGAGNSVAGGAFSSSSGVGLNANAIGTVVQNTLDGQKIQNVTVINATANSLGVLRELNLQNSLRSSLIDSLRR
jgi:hypothetical protein